MVGTRSAKVNYEPSATSYGQLYDTARKHACAQKKQSSLSSKKKVTRASLKEVVTPPELKRVVS